MSGLNYGNRYTMATQERPLKSGGQPKKKVYQFDTNEQLVREFESVRVCSEETGINRSTLINYIRGIKEINKHYYSYNHYLNINTKIA